MHDAAESLDPVRYRRLKQVYFELVDLPTAEREQRLLTLGADDPALADEARSLLRAEAPTAGVVPAPAASPEPPRELGGERSYHVLRELGRGGMGVVYLAERADSDYRQQVAIKVLRGGLWLGEEALRRFRVERRVLAQLDHPNIARLLDGGTAADGVPFLVMEYVDGQPIDRWCEAHGATTAGRLRLFLDVCHAVQHAHQNLVVHRDLKPGNILVTAAGVPKLLDFGIARILDPQLYPGELAQTRTGCQPLTPLYASPEQLRGEPAAVASDVYSLGVVLYELLAGVSPYRVTSGADALALAITELPPEAPSAAVRRAARDGARRAVPSRDLDAVVLKALRKEPRRRYGSVAALAEDLQRHLDGAPVSARRGSFGYRAGKFLRRRRWPVAAAAVFLVVVLGFSVSLARQLDETARQRDAAARERDTARAVTDFLVDTFKVSDPEGAGGAALSARDVLDRGAARVVDGLAGRPEVQARLHQAVGRVYQNLGLPAESTRHLERALELARARRDSDPVAFGSALVDLASILRETGAFARAEPLYREAVTVLSAARGPRADETGTAKNGWASLLAESGRLAEAEPLFRELLDDMLAALHLSEPPGAAGAPLGDEYRKLAVQLHNLGVIELNLGHDDEAARRFEQALAVKSRLANANPGGVANTLEALGNVESRRERYAAALAWHERALALRREIYGEEHPLVAQCLVNHGDALAGVSRHRDALADLERARVLYEKAYGRDHAAVAMALNNAANSRRGLGDLVGALAQHREALAIRERVLGAEHADVALSFQNIAEIEAALGHGARALDAARRSVRISTRALGAEHPDTLERRLGLAKLLLGGRARAAAVTELEALVPALARADRPLVLADARFTLARGLAREPGALPRALDLARRAYAYLREHPDPRVGGVSLDEIAAWLRTQGAPS